MKKQLISSISSIAIIMNTIGFNLTANAKVIEPEIVKTETWSASYYIDDDMDTLYPYINCKADIYNDGSVKVYISNTHEWDGFATVSHNITIVGTVPLKYGGCTWYKLDKDGNYVRKESSSFYETYPFYNDMYQESAYDYSFYGGGIFNITTLNGWRSNGVEPWLRVFRANIPLCNLPVNQEMLLLSFKPKIDINRSHLFRLMYHEFSLPENLLSEYTIAQPVITESDYRIAEMQNEIDNLKKVISNLVNENSKSNYSFGDIDSNDIIDGRDATIILTYYAKASTDYTGTLEEYVESVKETES